MGILALGPRKKLIAAISSLRGLGQGKYSTADLYQGRYKLEESASMGGLNAVKLAIDMKTERKVALKFMGNREAFLREVGGRAHAARALSGPSRPLLAPLLNYLLPCSPLPPPLHR